MRDAASNLRTVLEATPAHRRCTIALSGGNTPKRLYAHIESDMPLRQLICDRAELFFSDERAVAPDHPDSNYGMALRHLLQPIGFPPENCHRMSGEETDLHAAADSYERLVTKVVSGLPVPSFDLIMLGMGSDGHTASLFPENRSLPDSSRLVVAPYVASKSTNRISMSLRLINAARHVLFLVTGEDKASMVHAALMHPPSELIPASLVCAQHTIWLLDPAAASQLPEQDAQGS